MTTACESLLDLVQFTDNSVLRHLYYENILSTEQGRQSITLVGKSGTV